MRLREALLDIQRGIAEDRTAGCTRWASPSGRPNGPTRWAGPILWINLPGRVAGRRHSAARGSAEPRITRRSPSSPTGVTGTGCSFDA